MREAVNEDGELILPPCLDVIDTSESISHEPAGGYGSLKGM